MGLFELSPVAGEKYVATIGAEKFPLPDPVAKGIAITILPHPQGNFLKFIRTGRCYFTAGYMIGQMQHQVVFARNLKPNNCRALSIRNISVPVYCRSLCLIIRGCHLTNAWCFVNNKEIPAAG